MHGLRWLQQQQSHETDVTAKAAGRRRQSEGAGRTMRLALRTEPRRWQCERRSGRFDYAGFSRAMRPTALAVREAQWGIDYRWQHAGSCVAP